MLLPLSSMPVAFVRYFGILWIMTCLCKHLSALCDRRKWGCNKCKYSWINSILIFFLKPWLMCLLLLLLFLFEWTWYGEMKHSTWHKLKIMDVFESQGSSWWYPVRDQDQAAFSLLVESHEFWFWFFLFLFFFKKKKNNTPLILLFQTVRQMYYLPVSVPLWTYHVIYRKVFQVHPKTVFLHCTSENHGYW